MRTCRRCGKDITWSRGAKGYKPINPDGSDHWPVCRKPYSGPLTKLTGATTGEHYRRLKHKPDCNVAPWEPCDCQKEEAA